MNTNKEMRSINGKIRQIKEEMLFTMMIFASGCMLVFESIIDLVKSTQYANLVSPFCGVALIAFSVTLYLFLRKEMFEECERYDFMKTVRDDMTAQKSIAETLIENTSRKLDASEDGQTMKLFIYIMVADLISNSSYEIKGKAKLVEAVCFMDANIEGFYDMRIASLQILKYMFSDEERKVIEYSSAFLGEKLVDDICSVLDSEFHSKGKCDKNFTVLRKVSHL